MSFAILRINKLKSYGNVGGYSSHVQRERETLNADPDGRIVQLAGSADAVADVKARIGDIKVRKNGVLAVDHMMTASPEHFKEGGSVKDWVKASMRWLKQRYGDRLVNATLHLDESTPHVHALVVPVDKTKEKLNARQWFGGRDKLSEMQDSYAAAVADLGLERGIKGSKAKHRTIKQYYQAVNSAQVMQVPKVKPDAPTLKDRLNPAEYGEAQFQKGLALGLKAAKKVKAKAAERDSTAARAEDIRRTSIRQQQDLQLARRREQQAYAEGKAEGAAEVKQQWVQSRDAERERQLELQRAPGRQKRHQQDREEEGPSPASPTARRSK